MPHNLNIDPRARYAIDCQGDFQYGIFDPRAEGEKPEGTEEKIPSRPFKLAGIDLRIPRGELTGTCPIRESLLNDLGALVAIVGRVGMGKSALLSGLLGDMRQSNGQTIFSDQVSYGKSSYVYGSRDQ